MFLHAACGNAPYLWDCPIGQVVAAAKSDGENVAGAVKFLSVDSGLQRIAGFLAKL